MCILGARWAVSGRISEAVVSVRRRQDMSDATRVFQTGENQEGRTKHRPGGRLCSGLGLHCEGLLGCSRRS